MKADTNAELSDSLSITATGGASLDAATPEAEPPAVPPAQERIKRQQKVHEWCIAAFGAAQASSASQRGLRLLEEAAETAQAVGVNIKQAHDLLDYVWS